MARWHKFDHPDLPVKAFQPRGWKGGMTLEGGGGGGAQDTQATAAQKQLADLAQKQWDTFMADIYPGMQSKVSAQDAVASNLATQDFGVATDALKRGNQAYQTYQDTALPALQKLKADADNYNEAGYQEQLAQGAAADINQHFDQQRNAMMMRQQAYGIDPTSGAAAGADRALGVQQALMGAQASNQVRQAAHELGLQKQANLYNIGTGLANLSGAQYNLGLGAGAQGFTTLQSGIANSGMLAAALSGQAGTAMSGFGQAGSLAASMANAQRAATAQTSAGYGQAIGTGLGAYNALKTTGVGAGASGAGAGAAGAGAAGAADAAIMWDAAPAAAAGTDFALADFAALALA
jgi:hypothetical protein